MLITKLKVAIAVVMAIHPIGAGVGLVYCQTSAPEQTGKGIPVTTQKQQPTPKADRKEDEKKDGEADPKVNAGSPLAKADPPLPLPENIVAAWKGAGAEVGWLRVRPDGIKEFASEAPGRNYPRFPSLRLSRRTKASPATCQRFASLIRRWAG